MRIDVAQEWSTTDLNYTCPIERFDMLPHKEPYTICVSKVLTMCKLYMQVIW